MPNPFPGMDPYLEGPLWSSLHSSLIEEIARSLAPRLRPKYFALPNTRVVLAVPDPIELPELQARHPDVGIYHSGASGESQASAVATAPLTFLLPAPEEMTQSFVEIHEADSGALVTSIEVLSPTNKRGKGLDEFRAKRQELLDGPAHYLEIDLLRIGDRFPSPNALPSVPYFVFLSRANRRPRIEAWPIALDQPLPTVPVPLLNGDPDVMLDLQRALNTIYEHYSYERATRHSGEPVVRLSEDQQTWADECLRKAGLRT